MAAPTCASPATSTTVTFVDSLGHGPGKSVIRNAIKPFSLVDWHRFLIGNASWDFLLEVLLRTSVTYILLIVAMRLLGRRVAGPIHTIREIDCCQARCTPLAFRCTANRGLLPPFLIALVVIVLQRLLARAGSTHRRVETLVSTDVSLLASDGRLNPSELARTAMPREKVYEAMRIRGWQHLGQISRLYMGPSGSFSFIPARPSKPGCPCCPWWMGSCAWRGGLKAGRPARIAATPSTMKTGGCVNASSAEHKSGHMP